MVEDSDSPEEEEAGEKKENDINVEIMCRERSSRRLQMVVQNSSHIESPLLDQLTQQNCLCSEFGMHELTDHVDSLTIDSIIQNVSVDKTETGPFKVAPLAQLAFLRF